MDRDSWRRSNVDSIIVFLSRAIKEENKKVRFGISPFGVWRNQDKDPQGSATQAGQTNYDDLYADILLWLKQGWIDYVAPQLYWEFGHPRAPYEILLDWWSKNTYGKHCYIGLGAYRANSNAAWKDKTLLPRQIEALRKASNVQGMIFFSSKSFNSNPNGWSDSLRLNQYREPAIVPPMPWIDEEKPGKPVVKLLSGVSDNIARFEISTGNSTIPVKNFIVYEWDAARKQAKVSIYPAGEGLLRLNLNPSGTNGTIYTVTAIDFENNESEPADMVTSPPVSH